MAKQTITITIDPDDQQATASSIKNGVLQAINAYEQAFTGDSVKISYQAPSDGLAMNFAPLPRERAFHYKVSKSQTVPLGKSKAAQ